MTITPIKPTKDELSKYPIVSSILSNPSILSIFPSLSPTSGYGVLPSVVFQDVPTLKPSAASINRTATSPTKVRATVSGNGTVIPLIYGQQEVGIKVAALGKNGNNLVILGVVCLGEIDSYVSHKCNGEDIPSSGITITEYTGTVTQTADATLVSTFGAGFTDDMVIDIGGKQIGVAYLVYEIEPGIVKGFPRFTTVVKGKKIFDPWFTGSSVSPYAWSQDPAACFLDFLSSDLYGAGLLGSDLVDDGSFAYGDGESASPWTFGTGWAVPSATGYAEHTGSVSGVLSQTITFTEGKLYELSFEKLSSGAATMLINGMSSNGSNIAALYAKSGVGKFVCQWIQGSSYTTSFRLSSATDGLQITGIRVKEVLVNPISVRDTVRTNWSGGTENVTNGTFDTATTGWTGTDATLSVATKALRITVTNEDSDANPRAAQTLSLSSGTSYRLHLRVNSRTATSVWAVAYDSDWSSFGTTTIHTSTSWGHYDLEFTPAGTGTVYLQLKVNGDIGEYGDFDDVSVQETVAEGEKRRTVNLVMASPQDVGNWIETWRVYCSCFFFMGHDGNYKMVPDRPREVDGTLKHLDGDFLDVPFRLVKEDVSSKPTSVTVVYTDASATPYRQNRATATLSGVSTGAVARLPSTVYLPGITNYNQALREAVERLKSAQTVDLSIDGAEVFDNGLEIEQGDVREFSHPLGITDKAMRILSVIQTRPGRWRISASEYSANVYDDSYEVVPTLNDFQYNEGIAVDWSTQVSGTGKPDDDATAGATWGIDITDQPDDALLLNVENGIGGYQEVSLPYEDGRLCCIDCYVNNNSATAYWFKVFEVDLTGNYMTATWNGIFSWGASNGRFTDQMRVRLHAQTDGVGAISSTGYLCSGDDLSAYLKFAYDGVVVSVYVSLTAYDSCMFDGAWTAKCAASNSYIFSEQGSTDNIGTGTPSGTFVTASFNYEQGADVTATNNNWSDVADDDGHRPENDADVTGTNTSLLTQYINGSICQNGYAAIIYNGGDINFYDGSPGSLVGGIYNDGGALTINAVGQLVLNCGTTILTDTLAAQTGATCGTSSLPFSSIRGNTYYVGATAGVDFNGAITNLTVVKGIVTAAS